MSGSSETITIAAAVDRSYSMGLAVMMRSAVASLDPAVAVEAFVVDGGLTAEERERIEASIPSRLQLHWVERPRQEVEGLPVWGRITTVTYYKLTIGQWLPERTRKAIWLDADVLVQADLAKLWRTPMDGSVLLACIDWNIPRVSSRFGVAGFRNLAIPDTAEYFNAGVLLIDLDRWRDEEIPRRSLEYLKRYRSDVFFMEQEALNAVLWGQWKPLDPRWNTNSSIASLTNRKRSFPEAWIIHFSGNLKPWLYRGRNPFHCLYYKSLDQTAWHGWRPKWSWAGFLARVYECSPLRRRLYPIEQFHLPLVRSMTRR